MSLPAGVFNETYGEDMAIVRTRTQWALLAFLFVMLLVLPRVASAYVVGVAIMLGIWIIAGLGLNILLGYCGQVSIAQSAFMAVGGYATAILETKLGLPFIAALPAAVLVAGMVGLAFGIPSLRIKGLYLALITLAAQFVVMWVLMRWRDLTGGPFGIHVPSAALGPLTFDRPGSFYYLVLFVTVVAIYCASCLVRSRVGRAFRAIRDNDLAAEALGVNVFGYKLFAFFLGCAFAGAAGALYVHHVGVADTEQYSLWQSIWLLAMIVIGGMGRISGTVFGVIFVKLSEELTFVSYGWLTTVAPGFAQGTGVGLPQIVLGIIVVAFLIFEPRGLANRWELLKGYYRIWPFAWQEKV